MNPIRPVCLLLAAAIFFPSLLQSQSLPGFSDSGAQAQIRLEARYDALLKAKNLDVWMKQLAARPHHVGSPYGKEVADIIAARFREWGFDTRIETFQVLFPTPKLRLLELVAPQKYRAGLQEPALAEDATSSQVTEQLPAYNCFSIDGDVTADLVFVNYGVPADYEELEKRGIDVRGKIVIAKYGGSWRGIKPKVAAEKGAIGCIIYSDPQDDGYFAGDVYPQGAFKNEYGVQRGSVLDMPLYPGDPLTPGYGATTDAPRLDRNAAPTLTQIPVLPISYHDAQPLLAALGGPVAPASWRGALPLTYHLGPGPAKVHLQLAFDWQLQPAYNVIAQLQGSTFPDQWVIRGNHHDAWVNGANDPISGMVALMEEARAIGELAKTGWRPQRTLVYCAWDAEEPGLLGSTEWVETHAEELRQKAVIYINTDGNGRGFLRAGGSHSLQTFFDGISRDVTDPQTGVSLFDRHKAHLLVQGQPAPQEFDLYALGSGSDYTPFIQHLGIPSFNIGFSGESQGGEYHSIYDSYDHYIRFKDPGFAYGVALAQVCGRASLRFAEAAQLPFDFRPLGDILSVYLDEVIQLTGTLRTQTEKENRLIREGLYRIAADPRQPFLVPEQREAVPYLNFAPLQNALEALKKEIAAFKTDQMVSLPAGNLLALNQQLMQMERALSFEAGLPGRPWYKHMIYAPGFYTGYGVKTLPGVREAIEQRNWPLAQEQIGVLAGVLDGFRIRLATLRQ